jgi:hypothetical protein
VRGWKLGPVRFRFRPACLDGIASHGGVQFTGRGQNKDDNRRDRPARAHQKGQKLNPAK